MFAMDKKRLRKVYEKFMMDKTQTLKGLCNVRTEIPKWFMKLSVSFVLNM